MRSSHAAAVRNGDSRRIWVWPLLVTALATALVRSVQRGEASGALPEPRRPIPREVIRPSEARAKQPGAIDSFLGKIPYGLVLRDAAAQWVAHNAARLGAALAYYSVFSIGPLIVIAIAVAGLFFGEAAARGQVTETLHGLVGQSGGQAIDAMLAGARKPQDGIVAIIIGTGTLILAAIGVVVQLKDALNTVWETKAPKKAGIWNFLRTYLLSLAGIMALGFLLLVSMLATAGLAAAGKVAAPYFPEAVVQLGGSLLSFAFITVMFAAMFKWLPDTPIAWRDVWSGAILTAALFELGKFLIALYIGKQGLESSYGAAASIVVVLIWVYYSAQIVLFGAEFTHAVAKRNSAKRKHHHHHDEQDVAHAAAR
jgi:membrane protein